jgi:hypothetical protein
MSRSRFVFLLAWCGVLFATPANALAQAPAKVEQVAWLTGCWEYKTEKRTVEEHWMAPRGHTMLGAGRTVQGEKLLEFEMVLIREQDGHLAYQAHPSGQASTVFLSRSIGEHEVVFENLKHDFPQQVGYTRDGDSLLAWIEGPRGGQTRRIEFPYRRVDCPAR